MTGGRTLWLLLIVAASACAPLDLYDVERVPVAFCIIRPGGEFCDDAGLPPPIKQTWAVEQDDDGQKLIVYTGGETWVFGGVEGSLVSKRTKESTRGGCTTVTEKTLSFTFIDNNQAIDGTYETRARTTGPIACGETPVGERVLWSLRGARGGVL